MVRQFTKSVQEKAVGADVMNGLNPGQMVIKIVNDELVTLMGGETAELELKSTSQLTVIMMMGLQGAGKTTTCAKLAARLRSKGRTVLLAACDVYRPAAIRQLEINGEKAGVEVFTLGDKADPVDIASQAAGYCKKNGFNVLILDTAGRLQIDENMMEELVRIKDNTPVDISLLVADAMTGQDAVNVSESFNEKVGIDGVILTKLDGDTRGGAALSIRAACGRPIYYAGMGEKFTDLEQFHPDRMASRILGMGDVMSLIEKAQESIDEEQARKMEQKLKKASFGFDDYLDSLNQMRKMGGMQKVLSMMPNISPAQMQQLEGSVDEKQMNRTEAIILSMTAQERANPDILNVSRKQRIARGAGVDIREVNQLVKQFMEARKFMKQYGGMMKGKGKRGGFGGKFRLPF